MPCWNILKGEDKWAARMVEIAEVEKLEKAKQSYCHFSSLSNQHLFYFIRQTMLLAWYCSWSARTKQGLWFLCFTLFYQSSLNVPRTCIYFARLFLFSQPVQV